eukprot:scaffold176700_cov18-Prasinocladus_malaysianus.AAC.1
MQVEPRGGRVVPLVELPLSRERATTVPILERAATDKVVAVGRSCTSTSSAGSVVVIGSAAAVDDDLSASFRLIRVRYE